MIPALRLGPLFNLVALSAPIAILVGIKLWKPAPRGPWVLFSLALLFYVVGDIITHNYVRLFHQSLPFPSIGNIAYLGVYPCMIAGILMLVHGVPAGTGRARSTR